MKTSPQIYFQILFRGICSTDRRIQSLVAPLMNPLARGYEELYKTQEGSETLKESKKDEFFGLRDFYRYECSLLSLCSLILCLFFSFFHFLCLLNVHSADRCSKYSFDSLSVSLFIRLDHQYSSPRFITSYVLFVFLSPSTDCSCLFFQSVIFSLNSEELSW